jgi:hypothetical protein
MGSHNLTATDSVLYGCLFKEVAGTFERERKGMAQGRGDAGKAWAEASPQR